MINLGDVYRNIATIRTWSWKRYLEAHDFPAKATKELLDPNSEDFEHLLRAYKYVKNHPEDPLFNIDVEDDMYIYSYNEMLGMERAFKWMLDSAERSDVMLDLDDLPILDAEDADGTMLPFNRSRNL